jgi:4-hydroxyphenylpyruvate dioxygenase
MSFTSQGYFSAQESKVQLKGIDFIELYVGNALQAAHFYHSVFGFTPIASLGLETQVRDHVSIAMQQGQAYLVLTASLEASSPIAEHVRLHGDGVKDITFRVADATVAFQRAVQWGARSVMEPTVFRDEQGSVTKATVATYGDTTHSFIQYDHFEGVFFPTYKPVGGGQKPESGVVETRTGVVETRTGASPVPTASIGLSLVDHLAISLQRGEVQKWGDFYRECFGFQQIHEENVQTEHSAMNSLALQDQTGQTNLVLIEPKEGKRQSQIEEFLKFYGAPGVQHIALHTENIVETVQTLAGRGLPFVPAPASYYDLLPERVGEISESLSALQSANVLVDRDAWGYLLQIFSKPLQDRPTLFIEIIQRKNARGFGSGNIQALFKALELEQARRGNL